jgi:hypothetical protein
MHRTRCPPCRGYTPELASSYTSIVAMGKSFEIVFVSSDQDEPAFQSFFAEMPWLALPFVCVFITAGPMIKLCAGGEGDSEGHVL